MGKTRLALIQMKMSSEKKKNISSAVSKIYKAKKKGAEIICLPELFLTNYFCQTEKHSNFNFAEKVPGPCVWSYQPEVPGGMWQNIVPTVEHTMPHLSRCGG